MSFSSQRGQSQSKESITKIMSILGAFAACVIAIVGPGVYYAISINTAQKALTTEAAFLAKSIEKNIHASPDLWEFESVGLKHFVSLPSIHGIDHELEIRNTAGEIVEKTDLTVSRPIISTSATFFDSGRLAGSIVVRHSIRTQIITTALIGILSSLFGCLLYFIFRTYPIRKLESTLIDLQRARDELEQRVADRTEELMLVNKELRAEITERKRVEKALQEGQQRQKAILDNIPDIAWLKDKESRFVSVNEPFGKSCGFKPEDLVGKTDLDIWPGDLAERYRTDDKEVMESGKRKQVEEPLTDDEGRSLWIETIKTPIYDEQGNVVGTAGIARDITKRKQAEEELKQTMESLRNALGTTIQVMVSVVEARDPYTAGHQVRSADLARAIATEMGLPQEKIDGIRMTGSIHDIGKLCIPSEILSKPVKLSEIEFSLIKEHSRSGYEILKDVESPWPLAEIVYQHHERMDGSGYPRNLKGDEIYGGPHHGCGRRGGSHVLTQALSSRLGH
ncbi:MAG: PAS domain S-box protein [Syntrophales bacterium]|nr:PAS domain S-box protein [Syntrophales bacterium]